MKKKLVSILISFICLTVVAFVTTSIFLYRFTNAKSVVPPDLSDSRYFIAHATGSIDGYVYMNCLESLINSLENGYQYIEVDLDYTADSVIVCVHDWEDFNKSSIPGINWRDSSKFLKIPTYEEFKQRKIYGRYTPLSLNDVISIRHRHPFTIVTDRISDTSALNSCFNKEIRNSVMVEAFSEEDYYSLKAEGYIPMLSLQLIPNFTDCFDFILRHSINNEIEWIVVDYHSSQRGLRLLRKLFNIKIAAYTVNLPSYFFQHLGNDIDLVYTDNWNLKTQLNNYQDWTTR